MEKELRIIISGGGTGGHIFPAVSIANAIIEPATGRENLICGSRGPYGDAAGSRCRL